MLEKILLFNYIILCIYGYFYVNGSTIIIVEDAKGGK